MDRSPPVGFRGKTPVGDICKLHYNDVLLEKNKTICCQLSIVDGPFIMAESARGFIRTQ